jgi:hypothetical protein
VFCMNGLILSPQEPYEVAPLLSPS